MAMEVLKTHDHILAGRTVVEFAKSLSHHKSSLIWGEYRAQWRNLRRISTVELFSPKRMEALEHLRRDEVFHTVRLLYEDKGKVVDIGQTVFCTPLNLLGKMIFSTSVFDPNNPESARLKNSFGEMAKLGGKPNLSDLSPFPRFLDPQGVFRETAKHLKGV
ncbi:corytuberine synthase-like [Cryptomeria japonica]|uniref:corytuberine synthase-like n=1 Tax=Cryptomeria japonica TaxID=3369 RepID=UPI0027DA19A5|nr:corytuberine synthase-like [Cryptomeria japonica]